MKKNGFTLIELIIVIGMMAVVMLVMAEFFFGGVKSYKTQTAELGVNWSARSALDDIDASVRQASYSLSSYAGYTAGTDVLILQVPSVNSSGHIVPGNMDHFVYHLSAGKLYRELFAHATSARTSGTKLVAEGVQVLVFTYNPQRRTLNTHMEITQTYGGESKSLEIDSFSRIRN
jgi:prepilin-type N-terminal cleavage/methylation domain-containing protein